MAEYKNLRISNNDPAVLAELVFDEPKSFPAKGRYAKKPGDLSYKFTLKLLAPWTNGKDAFNVGDEVALWLDNPQQVDRLRAFRKGNRLQIQQIKNADMQHGDFRVQPISDSGTVVSLPVPAAQQYSTAKSLDVPQGNGGAVEQQVLPPRITMEEALYEAYSSLINAGRRVHLDYGEEESASFRAVTTDGEVIQKLAVTIYMRG
jgi:hypothetical protein